MKEIPLTQGKVALVDDDVFEWASQFKWNSVKKDYRFYAVRHSSQDPTTGKRKRIYLHREIMKPAPGEETDHKFGNSLDNRRSELRNVTSSQNKQGFRKSKKNTSSRFRGVSWNKGRKKWQAIIQKDRRRIHLGRFMVEEAAARAYDRGARELFGVFAQPNFKI